MLRFSEFGVTLVLLQRFDGHNFLISLTCYVQTVYWSDVHERTVHRAKLDGTEHEVFLNYNHSLGIVDGEPSLKVKSKDIHPPRPSLPDFHFQPKSDLVVKNPVVKLLSVN